MPEKGRHTILRHVDRANNLIDRYLIHIMEIDGIYSGTMITDDEGNFLDVIIPEIDPNSHYARYREYLHKLSEMAQQLQEMTDVIKSF
jgi:hypothetical protein